MPKGEKNYMIRAVDVGFGAVKGVHGRKVVEFPSAVGTFRPIRFTFDMGAQDLVNNLAVHYADEDYFIGSVAYTQSIPRVLMSSKRFISPEGLALMFSALMLLADNQHEELKVVTGLPVSEFSKLKDTYKEILVDKHYIKQINLDNSDSKFYSFQVNDAKILPQPMGTIFKYILDDYGALVDKQLAQGRIAVLDIGKHTVDLCLTDALQFVDRASTSFNDIGLFDAYKELSMALKNHNYDIPSDSLEPYIRGFKNLPIIDKLLPSILQAQADKILSRVVGMWPDLWSFDKVFITGGGSILLGDYILERTGSPKVICCENPTFTNCSGYFKFAKKVWG